MAFINEIEDEYKAMLSHTVTVEGSYLEMRMLLAQWTRLCIHPMCKDSLLNKLATKVSLSLRDRIASSNMMDGLFL